MNGAAVTPGREGVYLLHGRNRAQLDHLFHGIGEGVDLFERRVDVGCHAQALIFAGRDDGRGPDAVLRPQVAYELGGIEALDADETDGAGLRGILVVQNLNAGELTQPVGPALPQITEARGFSLRADTLVEIDGFGDRV